MIFTYGTLTVRQGQRDPHNEGAVECKTTSPVNAVVFGLEESDGMQRTLHYIPNSFEIARNSLRRQITCWLFGRGVAVQKLDEALKA